MDIYYDVDGLFFEWDEEKDRSNRMKHGVSFLEAAEVFFDDFMLVLRTEDDADEHRIAVIGESDAARLLLVVHTERGVRTRIISARAPTIHERRWYERGPR